MSETRLALETFLAEGPTVLVTVTEAKGSAPRDAGAWMLVSATAIFATIGGGQLEFAAIDRARQMLANAETSTTLDIPLGPKIGQCCGGHVRLALERVDPAVAEVLTARMERETAARPHVYVFGAGHVGRALAESLSRLPVRTIIVETREPALHGLPAAIETKLTPLPEAIIAAAPPASAFVVLTHEHALDFLLTRAALERGDAAYVGMIGSATKRATFEAEFRRQGGDESLLSGLTCPIGQKLADKRPEVIAALVTAEVAAAVLS